MDEDALAEDKRDIRQQSSALRLYNRTEDCPTYAAILLFGKNPEYYLSGAYVQYVRFDDNDNAADIVNEHKFTGCLLDTQPKLDTFIETAIIEKRPKPVTILRESIQLPQMGDPRIVDECRHAQGLSIQHSDQVLSVCRPDRDRQCRRLYGNAKPENFPSVNDYRNPIIAEAMKSLGYVNRYNHGIVRVQKELRENGNLETRFPVDNITVFGVNVNDATYTEDRQLRIDFTNQDAPYWDRSFHHVSKQPWRNMTPDRLKITSTTTRTTPTARRPADAEKAPIGQRVKSLWTHLVVLRTPTAGAVPSSTTEPAQPSEKQPYHEICRPASRQSTGQRDRHDHPHRPHPNPRTNSTTARNPQHGPAYAPTTPCRASGSGDNTCLQYPAPKDKENIRSNSRIFFFTK